MSLEIGIVGLPNVGKSTLFNALTNNDILAANYPFATIEPNTGIVPVPDVRLSKLAKLYNTTKIIPATVTFVDIAGLVAGASQGEGLGNKFLANIRQCDAIIHIVRAFHDDNVIHISDKINPRDDIDIINTELMLADIETLEKHITKIQKESKSDPKKRDELETLLQIKQNLSQGIIPKSIIHSLYSQSKSSLPLLTAKPIIYVFNVDEQTLVSHDKKTALTKLVAPEKSIFVCAKLEDELKTLSPDDSTELLESYGVTENGLLQLIHAAYDILGLQSYLTAGPPEVRAWTIKQGATAPQAAGIIHGDFERGFIAAEIIDYDDLISSGSRTSARATGKLRTEGKTYIMQPNDVVEFRFNV